MNGPQQLSNEDVVALSFAFLFTVASAVGLIWIAAWWALRPDRPSIQLDEPEGDHDDHALVDA